LKKLFEFTLFSGFDAKRPEFFMPKVVRIFCDEHLAATYKIQEYGNLWYE